VAAETIPPSKDNAGQRRFSLALGRRGRDGSGPEPSGAEARLWSWGFERAQALSCTSLSIKTAIAPVPSSAGLRSALSVESLGSPSR